MSAQAALFSMCKVRRIKIHPDVSVFAFCHHWTRIEPSLPMIKDKTSEIAIDQQLDFGKVLVSTDNHF